VNPANPPLHYCIKANDSESKSLTNGWNFSSNDGNFSLETLRPCAWFSAQAKIAGMLERTRRDVFGMIDGSPYVREMRTFASLFVFAIAAVIAAPALAEFPPEGAVSDPNNPSVASADYQDPAHKNVTRHFIFYFDCRKRDWIGVSVAGTEGQIAPPQAVGKGREFPSGPPPGSKYVVGNSDRALNIGNGGTFVLRQGVWFDVKTGKSVVSPRLCPGDSTAPVRANANQKDSATLDTPKPDQLPPPPQFLRNRVDGSPL